MRIFSPIKCASLILTLNLLGCEAERQQLSAINRSLLVNSFQREKQLTKNRSGHILTNVAVWSPDSDWIVYETRSDPAGAVFDGSRAGLGNVKTAQLRGVYI